MVRSSFRSVGRTPSFLVTGLAVLLIVVSVSHWNYYTKYEVFSKKVSDLEAQIGISSEKQEELIFRNDALQQLLKEKQSENKKTEVSLNVKLQNEKKRLDDCNKQILDKISLGKSLQKALKYNEEAMQTISKKNEEIETLKQYLKTNQTSVEPSERKTVENLQLQIDSLTLLLADKQLVIDSLQKGIAENTTALMSHQNQIKISDDADGAEISVNNHGLSGVLIAGASPLIVDPPNAERLKPLLADKPVDKELVDKTISGVEVPKD